MSFKGEGNVSLIKWGISPSSPSGFISSTAAMVNMFSWFRSISFGSFSIKQEFHMAHWQGIISRLTEHRVHLPENFGTYKVVEWKVEPPSRR